MSANLFGSTFRTVRIDSPWPETGGGKIKRGCDKHYGTIATLDELERVIRSCPYFDRIADDCHAWFDASNRFTIGGAYDDHTGPAWAPLLAQRLGFRPVSLETWAKMEEIDPWISGARVYGVAYDTVRVCMCCEVQWYFYERSDPPEHGESVVGAPGFKAPCPFSRGPLYRKCQPGIGQYLRGETEQLLFCVRGDGMRLRREHTDRRDIGTLLCAPVPRDERGKRIHSRKPPESYALIEAASPGPYLEIFARVRHNEKWTVWGNEAPADEPAEGESTT